MPCTARFARLFPSSHSKAMTHYDKRKYICKYNIARTKLRVRFDFFSILPVIKTKSAPHRWSVSLAHASGESLFGCIGPRWIAIDSLSM